MGERYRSSYVCIVDGKCQQRVVTIPYAYMGKPFRHKTSEYPKNVLKKVYFIRKNEKYSCKKRKNRTFTLYIAKMYGNMEDIENDR